MVEGKFGITGRSALASIVLIANAFIWYSLAFGILKNIIGEAALVMWTIHFVAASSSAIAGATLTDKIHKRTTFLVFWMAFGIISSLFLMFINSTSTSDVLAISFLFGVSFGLGLPASMACFADCTSVGRPNPNDTPKSNDIAKTFEVLVELINIKKSEEIIPNAIQNTRKVVLL